MKHGIRWLVVLLVATVTLGPARAAGAAAPPASDAAREALAGVVQAALAANASLQALAGERRALETRLDAAVRRLNPELEAEFSTGAVTGAPSDYDFSVSFTKEFERGGKAAGRLRLARLDLEILDARIREARRRLTLDVTLAWREWAHARRKAAIHAERAVLDQELVGLARKLFDGGEAPRMDVALAEAERAAGAARCAAAGREAEKAWTAVSALAGFGPTPPAELPPGETPPALPGAAVPDDVLEKRPDLELVRLEAARAEAEGALARAEAVPNVTAGLGFERSREDIDGAGWTVHQSDNRLAVRFSIPLPVWDKNRSAIAEAAARAAAAGGRLALARRDARGELARLRREMESARDSLKLYDESVFPALAGTEGMVTEAYRLGEATLQDAVVERRKRLDAQLERAEALRDLLCAKDRWDAALAADAPLPGKENMQ